MSGKEADDALLDYEETEELEQQAPAGGAEAEAGDSKKGHYIGVHSSSFRDFMLKPELIRAIVDCGFEHPSEVQHQAIPEVLLGHDVLCQAKSGMGKTAVFVLTTLQSATFKEGEVAVLVMAHTRELAFQIGKEYERFSKYLPGVKTAVLFGGVPEAQHEKQLKEEKPQIIVGTPGRVASLIEKGALKVDKLQYFILDECDKMLETLDMRGTVQTIFVKTPHDKKVLMFSATLSKEIRPVCEKFMHQARVIEINADEKLTLDGLQQYYVKLKAEEKNRKLADLLDDLEFNQVVIFVAKQVRATELDRLLRECNFPSMCIHGKMKQEERLAKYNAFRKFEARILVATNLFGRGIDIERVNVVINYDFPSAADESKEPPADQYMHRVGRAGRFNTKGLAISFVSSPEDEAALAEVQKRLIVDIPELPATVDPKLYKA